MASPSESGVIAPDHYDAMVDAEHDVLTESDYSSPESHEMTIKGYAILEFPDSYFYLHDASLVIGRNTEAERLHKLRQERGPSDRNFDVSIDEVHATQINHKPYDWPDGASDPGHGHISLEGGIGGPQSSRHQSLELDQDDEFIAVHPPADTKDNNVFHFRGISKKHLRVKLDWDFGWILEVIGRNGAYVNEEFYGQGERILLDDKDIITISSLPIVFHVSDVLLDDEHDSDEQGSSNSEEQEIVETADGESGEEDEEDDEGLVNGTSLEQDGVEGENKEEEDDEEAEMKRKTPKTKIKLLLKDIKDSKHKSVPKRAKDGKLIIGKSKKEPENTAVQSEDQPKRRGPGRPPADGVMSKRERREREKAAKAGVEYGDPLPTKPKPKSKDGEGNEEEVEEGGEKPAKSRKRKRSEAENPPDAQEATEKLAEVADEPEVERSPSPVEADYTEEQLTKPDKTYHALLHEILRESSTALALPQIYRIIRKKWPYYKFRVGGTGWESSVRHNLGNNKHFKTAGKAGKGYFWTIDETVPFEPKAKRASEPSRVVPYYPATSNTPRTPQQAFKPMSQQQMPLPGSNQNRPPFTGGQSGQFGQTNAPINGQRPTASVPQNNPQPYVPYAQHSSNFHPSQQHNQHHAPFTLQNGTNNGSNSINSNINNRQLPQNQNLARPSIGVNGAAHSEQHATASSTNGPSAMHTHASMQSGRPVPYGALNGLQQKIPPPAPAVSPPNAAPGLEKQIAQRRLTAFEQLDRGETPRVFQRFRDTLSKSAADSIEAEHLRRTAQQAIDWIVARPRAGADVDANAHQSIRAIIKILRDLLIEDFMTSGVKSQDMNSPTPGATAASHSMATPGDTHATSSTMTSQAATGAPKKAPSPAAVPSTNSVGTPANNVSHPSSAKPANTSANSTTQNSKEAPAPNSTSKKHEQTAQADSGAAAAAAKGQ